MRRGLCLLLVALSVWAGAAPVRAEEPQITDPEGDFPVGFADLTGVTLSVRQLAGREYLDVTFTVAGPVTDEGNATLPVWAFYADVGDCELTVSVFGYPGAMGPAGVETGSPHAECAADSERDVPGGYQFKDNTVTVIVGLGDLPAVVRGATLTNLRAETSMANTTLWTADEAGSDKPWTIA